MCISLVLLSRNMRWVLLSFFSRSMRCWSELMMTAAHAWSICSSVACVPRSSRTCWRKSAVENSPFSSPPKMGSLM